MSLRLSGADFDGDTVLVLPVNNVNISPRPRWSWLKNFDPKEEYRGFRHARRDGSRRVWRWEKSRTSSRT
ncbi:MAG: hypothetical protein ACLVJ6_04890 [Merdibacter sp.]